MCCCNFCCSYLYSQQIILFFPLDVALATSFHILMLCFNFVGVSTIYVTFIHVHNNTLVFLLTMLHQHFHFFFHVVSCCCTHYCILFVTLVALWYLCSYYAMISMVLFTSRLFLHYNYSYIVIFPSSQLFSIASHLILCFFFPFVCSSHCFCFCFKLSFCL